MQQTLELTLTPEEAFTEESLKRISAKEMKVPVGSITAVQIERKNIDARQRNIKVNVKLRVFQNEVPDSNSYTKEFQYHIVDNCPKVIVVGAGPAGLFAALRLIERNFCPIVIERGKDVSSRKKDIALINRNQPINEESNYCFGEGGAGTFSDGKLFTRSKKKGNIQHILEVFHKHGAQDSILYEAHPHIGTDRLPVVIKNMRETILQCGGEVHFETKMTDLILEGDTAVGIKTDKGDFRGEAVILATGHSARDVYEMLYKKQIAIEAKGFAMGVRVEHPQALIDSIQYHRSERGMYLPAASYNLVAQSNGRGVYSFCMCPGGHIVPASTEKDGIVVNGMSASHRNSPYANSGIVVEVHPEDLTNDSEDILVGLKFQKEVEQLAKLNNGGLGSVAPAQRLSDFVRGKVSSSLPECSYLPGLISTPMHFWLPEAIGKRLQDGFKQFDRKMHGFLTQDAVIVGVESRSSSPIRIPRNKETLEHIQIKKMYPCGEGAGYAGGITSSALDGECVADMIQK